MFLQSQQDSIWFHLDFWFGDTIVRYFFPVFPLNIRDWHWEIQVSLMGKTGYKMVQVWMGTGNWGIFHWNDAWKGPDPFGDFPSLDMDRNICPLFNGIFKALFIELLGGLLGVCRQKSRYLVSPRSNKGGSKIFWHGDPLVLHRYSGTIMIPRFWNRHGCHTTNIFWCFRGTSGLPNGDIWKTFPKAVWSIFAVFFLGYCTYLSFI